MENLDKLINELRKLPIETPWVEFKHNNYDPKMIGQKNVDVPIINSAAHQTVTFLLLLPLILGVI
jgi:hypothetical protein